MAKYHKEQSVKSSVASDTHALHPIEHMHGWGLLWSDYQWAISTGLTMVNAL